jgi:hypothetical protein
MTEILTLENVFSFQLDMHITFYAGLMEHDAICEVNSNNQVNDGKKVNFFP